MISERTKALLQAAATIYATGPKNSDPHWRAVKDAYTLLSLIEAREGKCPKCGVVNKHDIQCERYSTWAQSNAMRAR